MWQKIITALLVVLVIIMLLTLLPFAMTNLFMAVRYSGTPSPVLTSTPGPSQINAVATQAAEAAARSDATANTVNVFASILNIVVVFFTLVLAGLAFLGVQRVTQLDEKVKQVNDELARVQGIADGAEEKIVQAEEHFQHKAEEDVKIALAPLQTEIGKLRTQVTLLVLGYQHLDQKRKDQAQIAFQKILAIQPDDPQANYALGRIYSGDKRYDDAIGCFKKALDAEPGFVEAKMELGLALRRQADQEFEEATKGIDKEHNGNEWRKAVKERNTKYQEAIRSMEEANKVRPGNWDILGALGGIYRRLGVYDSALSYYQEAYETNPDASYALGNVAVLSYAEGKQEAARQAFEKTIELATQLIDAQSSRERWWDYYDRAMAKLVLTQIGDPAKREDYNATGSYTHDYEKAIELTLNSASFESVLQGLNFLKEFQHKYTPHQIAGLDEIIDRIERAKDEMEAKEKTQKEVKEKVGELPSVAQPVVS